MGVKTITRRTVANAKRDAALEAGRKLELSLKVGGRDAIDFARLEVCMAVLEWVGAERGTSDRDGGSAAKRSGDP